MENRNFEYTGSRCNGFVMLFVVLLMLAAGVASIILGIIDGEALANILIPVGIVLLIVMLILACGFMLLEPNESRVLLFFGEYRGNFCETGYWWVNPLMSVKRISLRARNLNVDPIKVNDKTVIRYS